MKQKLLLHTCCGPCASGAVEKLLADFDVTLFFSNSNIFPREEYNRRLEAARILAERFQLQIIEDEYDHAAWLTFIKGFEAEPEQGRRCHRCFTFNMAKAAEQAKASACALFTTTLTISPYKDSPTIFAIGNALGNFLAVDLKKQNGFRRSVERAKEFNLYRQHYCGCEFSLR